jgi:hypothetical protein
MTASSPRERLLLALTVIGFVVPNVMLGFFIADHGLDGGTFLGDLFDTLPAAQISIDLTIAAVAFLAWTAWDGPRSGVRRWWVVFPATFLVGFCFGAPLYLLLREKAVAPASA